MRYRVYLRYESHTTVHETDNYWLARHLFDRSGLDVSGLVLWGAITDEEKQEYIGTKSKTGQVWRSEAV